MAYITKSRDTWDVISKEVYGSEYHADYLMAANPLLLDTYMFNAGVEIKTPPLGDQRNGLMPPWKVEAEYND